MKKDSIKKMALVLALTKMLSFGAKTVSLDSVKYQPMASGISVNNTTTNKLKSDIRISDNEIIYARSNIYANYEDKNNVYYKRYDPDTNSYNDISIFDMENCETHQYGANQNDFKKNFSSLIDDPLIWKEMQEDYPVSFFDNTMEAREFYKNYFMLIYQCGCGHAAATNRVFKYFEGREDDFLKTFGYPMYTVDKKGNIDFNYEVFMLDFFNYATLNMIDIKYDKETIKNALLKDYYERQFGYYDARVKEHDKNWQSFYDKWQNSKDLNISAGILLDYYFGNFNRFLAHYKLDFKILFYEDGFDKYNLDDIVASENFSLYKMSISGNKYSINDKVGSHYMYVSEITKDGTIVSSWGDRYVFDNKKAYWTSKLVLKK